jgi:hypothetical protein
VCQGRLKILEPGLNPQMKAESAIGDETVGVV